jgi:hypothetical protein
MKTPTQEQELKDKFELACDWIQSDISEKSSGVLAECLRYDIDKAIKNIKEEGRQKGICESTFPLAAYGRGIQFERKRILELIDKARTCNGDIPSDKVNELKSKIAGEKK